MTIEAARPRVSWRLPKVECIVDHENSCPWNGVPSDTGCTVVENAPDHLKILKPNTNISYQVASGQTAVIHYKASDVAVSDIAIGTSSSPFYLVNSTDSPGGRSYTYLLRESPPQVEAVPHSTAPRTASTRQ